MKKILIIDDEPDFCTLVQMQCTKAGIESRFANNLTDGMAIVKTFEPDVIILDNNLPDGSGWANAPQLLNENPGTILHLVTAKNITQSFSQFSDHPSGRLFAHPKPLSLYELQEIIA